MMGEVGGGPLHLPWINPRQLYAMTIIIMCMPLSLHYLYSMTDMQGCYKPACSDPPMTIPSELGKENKPFSQ